MPVWGSLYFQNASGPMMEQLIFFHDHVMLVLTLVVVVVGYVLVSVILGKSFNRTLYQGQEVESVWTILPGMFLLVIAFPSLSLLYLMEEMEDPDLTVKSTGRQWYWVYEYADLGLKSYESYMLPGEEDLGFRLMDVDNKMCLPYSAGVRLIITSGDVIHSWTVPSLGVKVDGIPGRLNQLLVVLSRPGIYVGQCSEICGANHSFMPVVVSVVSSNGLLGGQ